MTSSVHDDNLREWTDTAPFWEKHAATIRAMFSPVTAALIEDARIGAGQRVLDVAGGAGEPALTIAEVVGPAGSVAFTDPVAKMVGAAEAEARRKGITNISFHQCPADALPFAEDSFDAVVSRLGAMFFPDPLAALREMRRAAKPGGVLSLVVWYQRELNPFLYAITNVVSRHFPAETQSSYDALRFAEPGKLAGILQAAGAANIRERILKFQIAAPISAEEFWVLRSETSATLRDKLKTASVETRARVKEEMLQAIGKYFPANQMKFPAQMLIVTGSA